MQHSTDMRTDKATLAFLDDDDDDDYALAALFMLSRNPFPLYFCMQSRTWIGSTLTFFLFGLPFYTSEGGERGERHFDSTSVVCCRTPIV